METALPRTNVRESWLQSISGHNVTDDPQHNVWYYLSIYLGLSMAMTFTRSFSHLWVWRGSIRASKILFERLTFTVLRAPLRWLDTVPVGRVLNRFTADFATFDSDLGDDLAYLVLYILEVMGIVAAA
jgi:ABC-type multidrug transport system fused ATPase/permease subunit